MSLPFVHRARVRKDIATIEVCCERMRESLVAFGEREISVVRTQAKKTICQFCHAPFKGMRIFRMRGWRIDPRYWDIDEGGEKNEKTILSGDTVNRNRMQRAN